ncbi:MAG: fumarylacetoacetate hydrolase family protein [Planctomycetes bacterium]|nr:fumarylacetoacetate hydrolase family protein [Planctomycetota bacterium]
MQFCKVRLESGETRPALLESATILLLKPSGALGLRSLADLLHHDNPREVARELRDDRARPIPVSQAKLLAPVDEQEIWAAGVTYKRSQEARERESVGAARFYDLVYSAERPELFFKAPASRARGPGESVRIRRDSRWSVPEPELTLVISPKLKIVGYTIGNDMSARDIEGENPLYLPQAKMYDHSCAIGPVITLADAMPPLPEVTIRLVIERQGGSAFDGTTSLTAMARSFPDLIAWLGKETSFLQGALLLTGTGIVPPDDFTLQSGDLVHIDIAGIGRLTNPVEQRA